MGCGVGGSRFYVEGLGFGVWGFGCTSDGYRFSRWVLLGHSRAMRAVKFTTHRLRGMWASALFARICLENATVPGRAWYKLVDAPVLTLDVTV